MQSDFIEFNNSVVLILMAAILVVFAVYVFRTWRAGGRYAEFKPAFAFSVFVSGLFVTKFWSWLWLWQINRGIWAGWMDSWPVIPLSLFVTIVGACCVLRIFTPSRWSLLVWSGSLAIAIVSSVAFFYVDR